jgi:rod shape-determining protein MreD
MLLFAFCLSLAALLVQSTLYPDLPILAFAPFLSLSALTRPLTRALLLASAAGFLIDLLSNDPFGLHSLAYCLATLICYRFRNRFSNEEPIQFALYTALLSASATLTNLSLLFLFDRRIPFCGKWWVTEWFFLPLADAVYALIWFAGPLVMFQTLRRHWVIYWLKKKNPFPT